MRSIFIPAVPEPLRLDALIIAIPGAALRSQKLQERPAKMVGGVALIKVGAATEIELKEKRAQVEDAMHATKAAVEQGIVPGGGV